MSMRFQRCCCGCTYIAAVCGHRPIVESPKYLDIESAYINVSFPPELSNLPLKINTSTATMRLPKNASLLVLTTLITAVTASYPDKGYPCLVDDTCNSVCYEGKFEVGENSNGKGQLVCSLSDPDKGSYVCLRCTTSKHLTHHEQDAFLKGCERAHTSFSVLGCVATSKVSSLRNYDHICEEGLGGKLEKKPPADLSVAEKTCTAEAEDQS